MNDPFALYSPPSDRRRNRSASETELDGIAENIARKRRDKDVRAASSRLTDNPDKSGEARQLARQLNIAPIAVEENIDVYRDDSRRSQVARAAGNEKLSPWLRKNSEIASDDVNNLMVMLGTTTALKATGSLYKEQKKDKGWLDHASEVVTSIPGRLFGSGGLNAAAGLREFTDAAADFGDAAGLPFQLLAQTYIDAAGLPGAGNDPIKDYKKRSATRARGRQVLVDEAARIRKNNTSDVWALEQVLGGMESVLPTVAAAATRNPRMAVGVPTAVVGGNEYREGRNQGLGAVGAANYAARQMLVEYTTEKIPASGLVNILTKGTPFGKALVKQLATEIPGEQVATFVQDLDAWALLPENREKTINDFFSERPEAALSTLLGTVGSTTTQTAIVKGIHKAAETISGQRRDASRMESFAELMDQSADNKVRSRDPEAFRELIDDLVGEDEKIFVPAETIRTLNQDYAEDEFWGDYVDDINEALVIGGEVSLPVSDVAARLAGTPDWEAISGDVRSSATASSMNEIDEANAELEALEAFEEEQFDRQELIARSQSEPKNKLRDNIRAQLMNVGMTPEVAAANTEVVASLFETEAVNLGREITGNEFTDAVGVQRVLPEILSSPEASDTIDLVINAVRQGKDPLSGIGPSLLQFIGKRGGINDSGGDLKGMGLPARLIRDFDPKQGGLGGISDAGDYGVDSTLRAAITEGYFPELETWAEKDGPDETDTQILLDAIERELGGEKLYSETREDYIRGAAVELREALSSRGVNVDTASDDEIRTAIEALEAEQVRQFDQSSIEIDGKDRPTTNSEGQPIAQTEEGLRNFWAWFGDSKVVDAEGKPLVVQHGGFGIKNIEQFDGDFAGDTTGNNDAGAFHFVDNAIVSEDYGRQSFNRRFQDNTEGLVGEGIVDAVPEFNDDDEQYAWVEELANENIETQSVYLNIESPVEVNMQGERIDVAELEEMRLAIANGIDETGVLEKYADAPAEKFDPSDIEDYADEIAEYLKDELGVEEGEAVDDWQREEAVREVLLSNGIEPEYSTFDGIIVENMIDDISPASNVVANQYIAFDPAQIKSVDNTGEFNSSDPRILHQGSDAPQGRIKFAADDAKAVIELFEGSNLSTFQHEIAHFWLERFKGNALSVIDTETNEAAQKTADDWLLLKSWFKDNGFEVGSDNVIPEGAHELFARGWERYLMEGKAPRTSLKSAFRKFSGWLRSIYRTVRNLNSPIKPEVRDVMDRMLATQDQIAEAAEERNMHLMFDDAVDAGMSEEDAKRYKALGDDARSEAEEELYNKVYRSIRAREKKQWRNEEKVVRTDIADAVERRPIFKALQLMRDGNRIDRDWIVATYGEDALKLLPAGVPPIYKNKGEDADRVAEMAGFQSGDLMVRELMGLEKMRREMKNSGDKRTVKNATIDQETAEEMASRYGNPFSDGSIDREAASAIQNERQGERLEMELRALSGKTNRRPTPYALAKEWARDKISKGVVADTISGEAQYRYTRTAAKASREAQAAFLRGDNEAAFQHKQTEMLHNALGREAAKANEKVETAVKRLGKVATKRTIKTMAQDYLDRIHGLLEGYEFKRVTQRQLDARDEYAKWAQKQTEAGHDVVAVERLAQKKNWSRLTVDELISLDDAVKQLSHLGRRLKTLQDGKERREFDEIVGEVITSAAALPQKKKKGQFGGETRVEWLKSGFASLHSVLVKMEDVFDRLDSDNPQGVFNRVVFNPLVEAQSREQDMLDDFMGRLIEAMKSVPKTSMKRWHKRRTIDTLIDPRTGEPANMLGEELLVMALNMGNRGNMEKLIGGMGWDKQFGGMDNARAAVMDVLNKELTSDDWNYVQTVWDTINELWPEISALEKRVNGFAPEKVEATSIETSAGVLSGGYFPVVYDPESKVGGKNLEVEEKGLFPSTYFRSTTRAGSTRERSDFKGPLHLSLGVINRHVAEVVHDITHREAVMNADKLLSSERVQEAVTNAMGPEIVKQFRPWLSHIANEWATDREGNSQAERFLKATRTNATVVGLGFRISTIMLQVSGYANSIERVGLRYVARGIRKQLTNPSSWSFALNNSKELRSRMTSMDRDIRDNAKKLASKQGGIIDVGQQFAFHGIGYMDRLVSVGTWLGAYDKALAANMTEEQAVYEADKSVRQSQGSGAAKDMARVQRGTGKMGEAWKLSTMFYSYSSAFYQRQTKLYRDIGDASRERDLSAVPDLAARFLWLNIVPALIAQLLAGRGPDEDEDEGAWAMAEIITAQFQGIPMGREIAGGLNSGFGYSYTPAEGFGRSIVSVVEDIKKVGQGEETKRATRNFLDAVGYTTGKIPGQIGQSTQFLIDVGYGEQDPETIAEWWEGVTKGKIK